MNTRGLLATLSCVVLVAGCANIPAESHPEVIPQEQQGQTNDEISQPAKDIDALTVVRDFVHASGQPANDNASARVYLDQGARKNWQPDKGLTIIEDTFGTVYADPAAQSADPNEQVVMLRGVHVGRLGPDSAFIPMKEAYAQPLRVRRQQDGQWRIADPPTNIVITDSDFSTNYFRAPVLFFAPGSNALVPDLRYAPASPQAGRPSKIVELLLSGPSDGLKGAVNNPLGEDAAIETNVTTTSDGALLVPLSGVGGQSVENKKLIAAQVVLSLQGVTSSRIRLLSDGAPLIEGHQDWRPSDLPSYEAPTSPNSELPGLVSIDGKVRSLGGGGPVPGPAGSGAYQVVSAGQSIDGNQLAIVERDGDGVKLRVGDYGREAQVVPLSGTTMTRPTWRSSASSEVRSNEFWTVADGTQVARVLRTPSGAWIPQAVNAAEVAAVGPITELRLSRDGSRAAVVAGGQMVVASVVRTADSVTLRAPRILQGGELNGVVDVDWASQDTLVVAASSPSLPVARLPIDGLRMDKFNSSNLTTPVNAITAAPSRAVVVADGGGLWTASDVGEVWRPHPRNQQGEADPFYPG